MGILCNPATTPRELARGCPPAPAWMACHFEGRGLRDLPRRLPPGSLRILDDSTLPEDPDPERIGDQLTRCIRALSCAGLLLDFESPEDPALRAVAVYLDKVLPCPVALPDTWGQITQGPVFLTLLPPHSSLAAAAAPWQGRELWLELGPAAEVITLTAAGAEISPVTEPLPPCPFRDPELCCAYGITCGKEEAVLTLSRGREELRALLHQAEDLGFTSAVGLYDEIGFLLQP